MIYNCYLRLIIQKVEWIIVICIFDDRWHILSLRIRYIDTA